MFPGGVETGGEDGGGVLPRFPHTAALPILSSHHHITSSSSHRSGHYSSLRQTTTPLLVLFLLLVFQEGGNRGEYGRPRGEGRRNAPRQGCLGRRSGPGTRLSPRSQPPRAPLAPCTSSFRLLLQLARRVGRPARSQLGGSFAHPRGGGRGPENPVAKLSRTPRSQFPGPSQPRNPPPGRGLGWVG